MVVVIFSLTDVWSVVCFTLADVWSWFFLA